MITELERRRLVEVIEETLTEIEDSETYVNERIIDGLREGLAILGVRNGHRNSDRGDSSED